MGNNKEGWRDTGEGLLDTEGQQTKPLCFSMFSLLNVAYQ